MRIYKVVLERRADATMPYGKIGGKTFKERRYAESHALWWSQRGWKTKVIQSTEFDWEE